MPTINDIDQLDSKMIANVKYFAEMTRQRMPGYKLYISETRRELSVQMAYYSRGRCPIEVVKDYFDRCSLWKISDADCKIMSTKTLYSKHIDGLAVDAYLFDIAKNKILYTPEKELWLQLFAIAEDECGLDACAAGKYNSWKWDWPHFEYRSNI